MPDANYDNLKVTQKLQLGDKWSLFGNGDPRANDEWLRLLNKDGSDYSGGLATQKLWTKSLCVQEGDIVISRTGGPTSNMTTFVAQKLDPPSINWQHDKSGTNPVCYGYLQVGDFGNTKEFRFVAENKSNFTFLNGNVGIGTTTPATNARLNVVGGAIAVAASPYTADAAIHIRSSFGGFDRLLQMSPDSPSKPGLNIVASMSAAGNEQWWAWGVTTDHKWRIHSGTVLDGTDGLTINTSGNVGIGNFNPEARLHLSDNSRGSIKAFSTSGVGHDFGYDGGPDNIFWFAHTGTENGETSFLWDSGVSPPRVLLTLKNNGDIHVSKDIVLENGADCAEDFDVLGAEVVEPGTVMVIDQEGQLRISTEAYDKKVAGVVSGAGELKPGMVLNRQSEQRNRMPIALMGKVYCKVDAQFRAIEVGDLLTTSPTPGHAMKAIDPSKVFGAVIGKALKSLEAGTGLIPIIVALQ